MFGHRKNGAPKDAYMVQYFGGYSRPINPILDCWVEDEILMLLERRPSVKGEIPYLLSLSDANVASFTMTGEHMVQSNVSGGGVSIGGALVGAAIAGPVGAVLGGRKAVRTETWAFDTRRLIVKFTENDGQHTIQLGPQPYNDLCVLCMEKQI